MKVIRVITKNYTGIDDIDLVLDGKTLIVKGPNAMGKTSLINSIFDLIMANTIKYKAIKKDKDNAKISVVIGNEEKEFVISRTFTEKNPNGTGTLSIKTPDGAKYDSPVDKIHEIVGNVYFDMDGFLQAKNDEEMLKELKKFLKIDTSELDRLYVTKYNERTAANKEVTKYKASLEALAFVPEEGKEYKRADATAISKNAQEREAAQAIVTNFDQRILKGEGLKKAQDDIIDDKNKFMTDTQAEIDELLKQINVKKDSIAAALKERDEADKQSKILKDQLDQRKKEREEAQKKVPAPMVLGEEATKQDEEAAKNEKYLEYKKEYDTAKANWDKLDLEVKETKAKITDHYKMINNEHLHCDGETVTVDGLPLININTAERAMIALQLVLRSNPSVHAVRCDISMMDKKNEKKLRQMLTENNYQGFLEEVDRSENATDELTLEIVEE
jgi:hypothetical protein